MQYGLIGEHLPHSFSKIIHEKIASYNYDLHELMTHEVDSFMRKAAFRGINVTIPYKQTVIPYLDEISDQAAKIGAVNTIVNRDGKLCGYNTDYFGMRDLLIRNGTDPAGKKVLILGTGGTSKTAYAVVSDLGAAEIHKVSRTGKEGALTYEEACTVLVLEAQKRGIPAQGGLYMLVVQAVYAAELFTGKTIDDAVTEEVYMEILNSKRNIVLTGMSLAGKTTLGTLLSQKLDRRLEDTDDMIVNREQRPITDIFSSEGEPYFRDLETAMVRELAPQNGIIISTGGGAILREENVDALKKNGCVIFLDRPLEQILPADDRPLANTKEKVTALMEKRYPIYRSTCDDFIPNNISPEDGAAKILAVLQRA